MKYTKTNSIKIEGDEFEGIAVGISPENAGFLFDIVSNQMYKNPIGSLIREITSNCFDAHVDANNDDPIDVELDCNSSGCPGIRESRILTN